MVQVDYVRGIVSTKRVSKIIDNLISKMKMAICAGDPFKVIGSLGRMTYLAWPVVARSTASQLTIRLI
jgi:hypothetical protein